MRKRNPNTHTHWCVRMIFFRCVVYLFTCLHFVVHSLLFFLSCNSIFWKQNAAHLIYGCFFFTSILMFNILCLSLSLSVSTWIFSILFYTGILIMNQSQQRIHQISSDLHINAVQRNDSGRYTCAKICNNKQSPQQVEILKNIKLEIICKYRVFV